MRRHARSLLALVPCLLSLAAGPPASACPANPADVAPGVAGSGAVPTWTADGDGLVTVRDLVTLRRAAGGAITLAWSSSGGAGCPRTPGDVAPGASLGAGSPAYWSIAGDGVVTQADIDAALDETLGVTQFVPGAGHPLDTADHALAGQVLDSDTGAGLPGVTVTVQGPDADATTRTDAAGEFLVTGLPFGTFFVTFDGSTTTAPGQYPRLVMMAEITGAGTTDMPPTTLPDLTNPASAKAQVAVDGTGTAPSPFTTTVTNEPVPDLGVSGPAGTKVTIDGMPPAAPVDIVVTPVPPGEVPMELPADGGKLNPASFATVQPANAAFDTNGAAAEPAGLDVLLPNDKSWPIGTAVEVWSYDHGVEAWVNRSDQVGETGLVVDIGGGRTAITAQDVIVAGGWHAAVVAVAPSCATRLTGHVVDAAGKGLAGVFVGTSVGSFGLTDANGNFAIEQVPAYSGVTSPGCAAIALDVTLRSPMGTAHETRVVTVPAGSIVRGGTTALGNLVLPVDLTACLGGRVTDGGVPASGTVHLEGPSSLDVALDAGGSFFVNGLAPGTWTAAYQFAGEASPRVVAIVLPGGACTAVNLVRASGSGDRDIDVLVVFNSDGEGTTYNPPLPGALVQLFGTDPASAGGLLAVTGPDGVARFENVDGPFFVTAQADVTGPRTGARARLTTSLPDIDPKDDGIGAILFLDEDRPSATTNATVSGTVQNAPANGPTGELRMQARERGGDAAQLPVAPAGPGYSLGVRSGRPVDVMMERIRMTTGSDAPTTLSVLLGPALVLTPGQNQTVNFDFASPNRVPFNVGMTVSITNAFASRYENGLTLAGRGVDGQEARFDLFYRGSGGAFPASVGMPNLAAAGLSSLDFHVSAEEYASGNPDLDMQHFCSVRLGHATPATLAVPFSPVPTLVVPGPASSIPVDAAHAMQAQMSLPPGDTGLGLNGFMFRTGPVAPAGLDGAGWNVFVPAGTTSVELHPPPRPVFASGGPAGAGALLIRTPVAVDRDALFSKSVNQNFAELFGQVDYECESEVLRPFEVTSGL